MQKKIDFTNCKKLMSKAYNGANGKKIAIEYEGEQYMLKFPPSAKQKANALSYSNSCYSEHYFQYAGNTGTENNAWNLCGERKRENCLCLQGFHGRWK